MGIHESEIFEGKFKSVTTCATRVMPERDVGHMPIPGTVFPGSVFAHVCEWRQLLDTTQENTIRQVLNKPKKGLRGKCPSRQRAGPYVSRSRSSTHSGASHCEQNFRRRIILLAGSARLAGEVRKPRTKRITLHNRYLTKTRSRLSFARV